MMIKPKPFSLLDMDGEPVNLILSRFPATVGREIGALYPMGLLPKIGDYKVSDETMQKLMSYVGVKLAEDAEPLMLKTRALIDSHTHDAETLMKVEMAMLEYNFSFFQQGRISDFLGELIQGIVSKIIAMSNPSSEQSSNPAEPPCTN